jgi:hypothetical protein
VIAFTAVQYSPLCCHGVCRARDKGLRTASLIRFVGEEDGLLSHTYDGPRMYINLEGAPLDESDSVHCCLADVMSQRNSRATLTRAHLEHGARQRHGCCVPPRSKPCF